MEDDCVCEYDSTWDTESDGDDPAGESQTRRSCQDKNRSGWTLVNWHHTSRNIRAAKDMQNYRRGYPNLTDDECSEDKMNNLQFYLNKFPSAPDDIYIESFLKEWKNDYKRLERVHSYIQWLFPLREPGVNYMASELSKKEIEAFKKNVDAKKRLVESYELMLGFYGMRLVNKETGEVKRADNWKERFGNLERNMHNNLRITRILKSLGELGFEHYQAPLVHFFLEETLVKKTLSSVKRSVLDYFLFAVLDKQKRQELVRFAYLHFEPKDKFVWCPRKVQKQFRKAEKRANAVGNGDVKDEAYLRSKSKDGEAVVQQKEDGTDNIVKTQKGSDKTASKDKNKLSEGSPEPKAAAETGNAEAEPDNILGNGKDSADDVDEMDQSASPDSVTSKTEPCADDDLKDTMQEPDNIMQTDEDIDTQKPPQKKGSDKTASKEKNKLSEASPEPKPAAETVGNGNAEAESDNDILGNGKDSADDVDEMDQSASPDSVTSKTEPCAGVEDAMQEPDNIMQTDEDIDTQKPPKKKREDSKVQQSNGSAGDSPCGQVDEKAGGHKTASPTSPSAQTAPKTSKHSPSLSSGREEKIPRTDFNQVPDKQEEEETL